MSDKIATELRIARARLDLSQKDAAERMSARYPKLTPSTWQTVLSFAERGWVDKALVELVGKGEQA